MMIQIEWLRDGESFLIYVGADLRRAIGLIDMLVMHVDGVPLNLRLSVER